MIVWLAAASGTHELHVYLPRDTGTAELYCSLPEALYGVAHIETDYAVETQTTAFFRSVLEQHPAQHPILLRLADRNMRRVFSELDTQVRGSSQPSLNGLLDERSHLRVAGDRKVSSDAYRMDNLINERYSGTNPTTMHILMFQLAPGRCPGRVGRRCTSAAA